VKYIDFDWEMNTQGIKLDNEIDIKKLGWQENDYFKLVKVDDKLQLVKIDEVEKFIRGLE
jgi:hypothetical protein